MLDSPAFIAAASAILGAIVGTGGTLLATWLRQRSEERKHYRELMVSLALESWKEDRSLARLRVEKSTKAETVAFLPLDGYLIHSALIADMVISGKLDSSNVEDSLSEIQKITGKVSQMIYENSTRKLERSKPVLPNSPLQADGTG